MYKDGFKTITNVDISNVVVSAMQQKYADCGGMTCIYLRKVRRGGGENEEKQYI